MTQQHQIPDQLILDGLLIISEWEFVKENYVRDTKEEDLGDLLLTVNNKMLFIISTSFQESKYWQNIIKPMYKDTDKSLGWLINTLEHKKQSRYFHLQHPISLYQLREILTEFCELILS